MKQISERLNHTKITHGYCLICGVYGKLSIDHVPPQGAITVSQIEQRHISEMMGAKVKAIKGVRSSNGSKFKTICHKCNSEVLGANDDEVARVCKLLTEKVSDHFTSITNPYHFVSIDINPIKYARAMIGHILSATSVKECRGEQCRSSYFDPLKEFVLGNDAALSESHDIYFWFYPHRRHLSAKYLHFYNNGRFTDLSLLAFFPIAFLVAPKNEGIYPAHAQELRFDATRLMLNLSSQNIEFADFPFVELRGNQMYVLSDYQAIISYPIKGRTG